MRAAQRSCCLRACAHRKGRQLPVLPPPDDAEILRLHRQAQLAALQSTDRAARRGDDNAPFSREEGQPQRGRAPTGTLQQPAPRAPAPLTCSSAASSALWARTASASTPSMHAFLCGWLGGDTCQRAPRRSQPAGRQLRSRALRASEPAAAGTLPAHTHAPRRCPPPSTHQPAYSPPRRPSPRALSPGCTGEPPRPFPGGTCKTKGRANRCVVASAGGASAGGQALLDRVPTRPTAAASWLRHRPPAMHRTRCDSLAPHDAPQRRQRLLGRLGAGVGGAPGCGAAWGAAGGGKQSAQSENCQLPSPQSLFRNLYPELARSPAS